MRRYLIVAICICNLTRFNIDEEAPGNKMSVLYKHFHFLYQPNCINFDEHLNLHHVVYYRPLQHYGSIRASAIKIRGNWTCGHHKTRMAAKPTSRFIRIIHWTSIYAPLLCDCWEWVNWKNEIQIPAANGRSVWCGEFAAQEKRASAASNECRQIIGLIAQTAFHSVPVIILL